MQSVECQPLVRITGSLIRSDRFNRSMKLMFLKSRAFFVNLLRSSVYADVVQDQSPPDQRSDSTALSTPSRIQNPKRLQAVPSPTGVPPCKAARSGRDPPRPQRGASMWRVRRGGKVAPLRLRDLRGGVVPQLRLAFTVARGGSRCVDAAWARDRRGCRSRRAILLCVSRPGLRPGLRRRGSGCADDCVHPRRRFDPILSAAGEFEEKEEGRLSALDT